MIILNKKVSPLGFLKYTHEILVSRPIDKIVLHHTSSPIEIWQGSASMLHYYNLYQSRGWTAGPHIFIHTFGIWLFTPILQQGRHAGPEGDKNSIGIEIVGNYKYNPPNSLGVCENTALVIDSLLERFKLDFGNIYGHFEFDPDSFCSPFLNALWAREVVKRNKNFIEKINEEYENRVKPK